MSTNDPTTVRLGLVQMACTTDPAENLAKAERGIRDAAAKGAQIVCLQELFRSPYFCPVEDPDHFALAEPNSGAHPERLDALPKNWTG